MGGGEPRHGRRNNGLYAAEYVVVGDVDPRVGEHLLDVLGLRGIAAYLQPSADQHPVTRLTTLPGRPTDRLFVDRRALAAAREYYAKVTGEFAAEGPTRDMTTADRTALDAGAAPPASRTSSEFERTWASIIAGFDTATEGPATWPASEDLTPPGPEPEPEAATASRRRLPPPEDGPADDPRAGEGPSLLDGLDTFGAGLPGGEDEEDDDENYHPPPPPPLPRPAGITIAGILGVLAGLIFITDPGLLPVTSETAVLLGGVCLIAGVVALIGRLRSGDEDDPDDPDHGAVI
ncbi:MAG TPA: DUF308 domain-containing protein [Micromonosporaceae bacterium]|nr:DUF308 domain-containing protein [Micromonosporaceae bacterium]